MSKIPDFKLIRALRGSLSLQITRHGQLIVKAPVFLPISLINRFVVSKSSWITKHMSKFKEIPVKKKIRYLDGEEFLYLGNTYRLRVGKFKEIGITDTLNFPNFLKFRIEKEMTEWYMNKAKKLITDRIIFYAEKMGVTYKSIYFSDTISKWGSCTRDNILQFNWRLIMAPILVLDYVVVHELAHTVEKNHRAGFWEIVSRYKPAYKQYRKWLHNHSYKLMKAK